MDRYAVVGHPVAHSKSPDIHARFAELTGQQMVYERLELPLGTVKSHVARGRARLLKALGGPDDA